MDMTSPEYDEMLARHRREAKELVAQVTALRKSIGKGASSKTQKKQVQEQIALLETSLAERHRKECIAAAVAASLPVQDMPAVTSSANDTHTDRTTETSTIIPSASVPELTRVFSIAEALDHIELDDAKDTALAEKTSKKSRQAKRKETKAAKFEEMRQEAMKEAANTLDFKAIEQTDIERITSNMGLSIKEIPADGHCLYNALADQLYIVDPTSNMTFRTLRHLAATYMTDHQDDFMPFLTNNSGNMFTLDEFDEYCRALREDAVWGGQLEIRALSQALNCRICIVQSGLPLLCVGEDLDSSVELRVSYHRRAYGLGAHYNSLTPMTGGLPTVEGINKV
ncbi:hypothetical protein BASA61_003471 [Batrachochytrium salamandrivorans]|nr:hypothetical protein BASA61_003471 [Batrachochytrium salamandrivorans]KAH9268510.1 hypothetical protein BASA83_009355 [Batrachochytrium salamandrivorans]